MLFSCLIWLIWFWNSGQIRWLKLSEKSACRTVGEAGRSLTGFCLSSSYLRPVKSPDTSRDLCLYVYHLDMWTHKPSWANKVPPIWITHALSPRTAWFLSRLFSTDPFATYWSPLPGPPYSPAPSILTSDHLASKDSRLTPGDGRSPSTLGLCDVMQSNFLGSLRLCKEFTQFKNIYF